MCERWGLLVLVQLTDVAFKGLSLCAPVFSVGLMECRHNGILTTDIHYQVKLVLSVRIRAQRLHVTGPFTGTGQYNKMANRKKNIRPLTLL